VQTWRLRGDLVGGEFPWRSAMGHAPHLSPGHKTGAFFMAVKTLQTLDHIETSPDPINAPLRGPGQGGCRASQGRRASAPEIVLHDGALLKKMAA
jgi:hypothetical protein